MIPRPDDDPLPQADELPPLAPPVVDRPRVPDGYGVPDESGGTQTWEEVQRRLAPSLHYWLASVRPDGTPHSIPRWGVWLDGRFFYDGAPTTRHARNVEANPACTITLESGTNVVIVEGDSVAMSAAPDGLGARLAEAFGKYADKGFQPEPTSWASPTDAGGLRVVTPRRVLAWSSFPTDCTRFTFAR